jgi:glycerol-3-phosphate acyltransferase PlsY
MDFIDIAVILISYLLGCVNTGYYYVRLFYRQDIRTLGTNATGAYNVSRIGGKKGFIITFLGDALKGAVLVLLCRLLKLGDIVTMTSILAVIIGHILPFQLKFKGGKGLSTAFGAFLAFHPLLILFWFLTSVAFFPIIRRYTVTCLFALMLLPLELFIADYPIVMVVYFFLYMLVIIYACRNNFREYINERAYQGKGKGKNNPK